MKDRYRALLLVSVAVAAITAPAVADTYVFRHKALVAPRQTFSFAPVAGVEPGTPAVSDVARVRGHGGKVVEATDGEYQICSSADCSDQGSTWRSAPTERAPMDFHARVRTLAGDLGESRETTLDVGGWTAPFVVTTREQDTRPDDFSLGGVTDLDPSTPAVSQTVTPEGYEGEVAIAADGGLVSVADGPFAASARIAAGQSFRVRVVSPAAFGGTATASVSVGTGDPVAFSATTRARRVQADDFEIAAVSGAEPSSVAVSAPILPSGFEGSIPVSVTGGQVSLDGTSWVASGEIEAGGTFSVRATAPAAFGTTARATVTLGASATADFAVTTRARRTIPDAFEIPAVSAAEPGSAIVSASVVATGFEGSIPVSAVGGEVSVDGGGSWATASDIEAGGSFSVRAVAPAAFATTARATVTLGTSVTGEFAVTTREQDTTPDAFSIAAVTGAAPSAWAVSAPISPRGFEGAVPLAASNGEVTTDNGASWTPTATLAAGGTFRVRTMSSAAFSTGSSATVTVGSGAPATFSVTTRAQDDRPDAFSIATVSGANPSTTVQSAPVTPVGYEGTVALYVTGGQVSVNGGGSWGTSASLAAGGSFLVRATSPAAFSTGATATVTVGSASPVPFTVTTRAQDTTPNAFSFSGSSGAELSTTTTSSSVTPAGYEGTVGVSASNGTVSVAGGAWTTSTTITAGQSLQARMTTASSYSTSKTVTVTVGGTSGSYTVTTKAQPSSGGGSSGGGSSGGGSSGGGSSGGGYAPTCSGTGDTVNNRNYYSYYAPDVPTGIVSSGHSRQFAHWFQFGATERRNSCWVGRSCSGSGNTTNNQLAYMAIYPDLQAAFASNPAAAYDHWINNGRAERRLSCWASY